MPRSSFSSGFVVGGVIAALALSLAAWWGFLDAFLDRIFDEEDRPPIIINNNSIDFRALPLAGSYGSWIDKGGNVYWHDYGAKKGANFFTVAALIGVDNCRNQAGNNDPNRTFEKLENFKIAYTDGTGKTITVSAMKDGNDRYVQVEAPDASSPVITNDLLKIGGPNITIQSVKVFVNANKWTECTFTGALQLLMMHPTKK